MLCPLCCRDHPRSWGEGLEDCLLLLLWGLRGLRLHQQPQSRHITQIHASVQNCPPSVSRSWKVNEFPLLAHPLSNFELLHYWLLFQYVYLSVSAQRRFQLWSVVNWACDIPADRQVLTFLLIADWAKQQCHFVQPYIKSRIKNKCDDVYFWGKKEI